MLSAPGGGKWIRSSGKQSHKMLGKHTGGQKGLSSGGAQGKEEEGRDGRFSEVSAETGREGWT